MACDTSYLPMNQKVTNIGSVLSLTVCYKASKGSCMCLPSEASMASSDNFEQAVENQFTLLREQLDATFASISKTTWSKESLAPELPVAPIIPMPYTDTAPPHSFVPEAAGQSYKQKWK
jgi:hypothetical protein